MHQRTILTLNVSADRCRAILGDLGGQYIEFSTADEIADWLWANGDEAETVLIDSGLQAKPDVQQLVEILNRDWPGVKIVWAN